MRDSCSEQGCAEAAVVSLGERRVCRTHYLAYCYERLETIAEAVGVKNHNMTAEEAEVAGRFLQDCMRNAADMANSQPIPSNLEKAQVYDMLLWASELHGRLRRSTRKMARFPILLRSDILGRAWEVRTETEVVSRHGMRVRCDADIRAKDTLICIRLDTGRQAEATVAWVNRDESSVNEAGIEFVNEENFWAIAWPPSDATSTNR